MVPLLNQKAGFANISNIAFLFGNGRIKYVFRHKYIN